MLMRNKNCVRTIPKNLCPQSKRQKWTIALQTEETRRNLKALALWTETKKLGRIYGMQLPSTFAYKLSNNYWPILNVNNCTFMWYVPFDSSVGQNFFSDIVYACHDRQQDVVVAWLQSFHSLHFPAISVWTANFRAYCQSMCARTSHKQLVS